jgi:hypothetical protein
MLPQRPWLTTAVGSACQQYSGQLLLVLLLLLLVVPKSPDLRQLLQLYCTCSGTNDVLSAADFAAAEDLTQFAA